MSPEALQELLDTLIVAWESEVLEFKDANDNFPTSDIGRYFSAIANEANLRDRASGWLVFGVRDDTHTIIGTTYREDTNRLMSLKQQIADGVDPSTTFRDIHVLPTQQGRVVMFEIPAAPRGIPIAWQGHYYARNHESLASLGLNKRDEIRAQGAADDWSAVICKGAAINDLDPAALARAREAFVGRHKERIPEDTIRTWDWPTFLDATKLTIHGQITRTAVLLVGRRESTHYLSPYVAELTWKLEGEELDYEHFHPPFLLETSRLYQRIRNRRLSLLPPGQLIPVDVQKYDQRIVLEALHNCIAHQDYRACERVIVIERVGELEFQNAGGFFDGKPSDYVLGGRMPRRYRNRFLAEAMMQLRMIDSMGFGIREVMFRGQARRYLPLPDYDLSESDHVVLRLPGRFIDENYSRLLLTHGDFQLEDIIALDHIQKGEAPDDTVLRALRKRGLVEGRKPALHISATVAEATDLKAQYIRTRRQDDEHYRKLILDYLGQWKEAGRDDVRALLLPLLPAALNADQKEHKVHNLLTALRKSGRIERVGPLRRARRRLAHRLNP